MIPQNYIPEVSFGYLYDDGSYSDQREPRGATCVPRRPRADAKWNHELRCWCVDGQPIDPQAATSMVEQLQASGAPPVLTVDEILDNLTVEQKMELVAKLATEQQQQGAGTSTVGNTFTL